VRQLSSNSTDLLNEFAIASPCWTCSTTVNCWKELSNAIIEFDRQHPEIQVSTEIKRTVGTGVDMIW